jgi:hypothetical protein
MSDLYILDGHQPVLCDDIHEWGRWFHDGEKRRVALTELPGDIQVSTVFLGMDHGWGHGPPLLFETMIFGGEWDEWQDRCSTWEEAEAMHAGAVEMASRIGN